ncbi:hypothetical protein CU098_013295 [Rhizopus stolonifer]|uniref:Uncharacterized protein n=1 Tax=Rhizopus stolonifer TaxID=4846 RepID=A0A367KX80_RHIST|nr:hypothetical protein CU098_013295 [Rhizopus stolonifer]
MKQRKCEGITTAWQKIQTTYELNEEDDISCPSTLPSSMVPELQMFPGGSDMDFLSYDNYELFTLLSAVFQN